MSLRSSASRRMTPSASCTGVARSVQCNRCGAGQLRHRLAFRLKKSAGRGKRASQEEAGERAMDGSARVDALHNLLAQIASLGKVQGAGLAGLLRQVVGCFRVANVDPVAGCSLQNAQLFQRFVRYGDCSGGGGAARSERGDGCRICPELKTCNQGAMGVENDRRRSAPGRGL